MLVLVFSVSCSCLGISGPKECSCLLRMALTLALRRSNLWIRKGETNRGLQNLDKEGGGKVYGQFDLIDLSRYAWFELGKRIFFESDLIFSLGIE